VKEVEDIERVQKRASKMVKECSGLKYVDRLKYLKIPCLKYRRFRGDLMMKNGSDVQSYPQLKKPLCTITRGHNFKLQSGKFRNNPRKFFFSNRVVSVWNELPDVIVEAANVTKFKIMLDNYMTDFDFVYDYKRDINI